MADIILGQHFILHFSTLIKIKLIFKFWTQKSIVSLYCILKNLQRQMRQITDHRLETNLIIFLLQHGRHWEHSFSRHHWALKDQKQAVLNALIIEFLIPMENWFQQRKMDSLSFSKGIFPSCKITFGFRFEQGFQTQSQSIFAIFYAHRIKRLIGVCTGQCIMLYFTCSLGPCYLYKIIQRTLCLECRGLASQSHWLIVLV